MPPRRLRTCFFVSRDDSCRKDSRQQRRAAIAREAILISALESGNYRCTLGRYKYTLEYREPNNTYRRRSLCRGGPLESRERKRARAERQRSQRKKKKEEGGQCADTIRFFIGNRRAMTGSNCYTQKCRFIFHASRATKGICSRRVIRFYIAPFGRLLTSFINPTMSLYSHPARPSPCISLITNTAARKQFYAASWTADDDASLVRIVIEPITRTRFSIVLRVSAKSVSHPLCSSRVSFLAYHVLRHGVVEVIALLHLTRNFIFSVSRRFFLSLAIPVSLTYHRRVLASELKLGFIGFNLLKVMREIFYIILYLVHFLLNCFCDNCKHLPWP